MQKVLSPNERIIVAIDIKPSAGVSDKRFQTLFEAEQLLATIRGTGVYVKFNSVRRRCPDIVNVAHTYDLKVFADLKLNDIPETLENDGLFLQEMQPELLTVMCATGERAIASLKNALPKTELLGVILLTSLEEQDSKEIYGDWILPSVLRLAHIGVRGGVDGVVCSAKEASAVRLHFGDSVTINCPGIRPTRSIVRADDQNPARIATISTAIRNGADRVVIGRPITQANNPYDALMEALDEVSSEIETRGS